MSEAIPKISFIYLVCVVFFGLAESYSLKKVEYNSLPTLPYPLCSPNDLQCSRKVTRTLLLLMEKGVAGMSSVDPLPIKSISLIYPAQNVSFVLRNLNVAGGSWTDLENKIFNDPPGVSEMTLKLNLQGVGYLNTKLPVRDEYIKARITINIRNVKTRVIFPIEWDKRGGKDYYILIGDEQIETTLTEDPTYYFDSWQRLGDDIALVENTLWNGPEILNLISKEIAMTVVQEIFENLKILSSKLPVDQYYIINK